MRKIFHVFVISFALVALTACGSDSQDDNDSDAPLKIIGKITYDKVGVNSNGQGLDYNNIVQEPCKQVTVKAINGSGKTIATTKTDDNGDYTFLEIPRNTDIKIRVYAELEKSGDRAWSVKVVDNTNGDAQYTVEGKLINTGDDSTRRNLNFSSGWTGDYYGKPREAAPFAILDSIYGAIQKVASADNSVKLPPLIVNWSVNNVASGNGTESELRDGLIVTSHFDGGNNMYILGDANSDTDEYDDHIITHEWGHYFESKLSRTDSIGGPHQNEDILDIRVAFSEGWCNGWSAIATDEVVYFDTMGKRQASGWSMNIEGDSHKVRGWYSEMSIQEIVYDLYDSNSDGNDDISLGFKPIYDVLVTKQKTTPAFTSIFPFIKGLKDDNPSYIDKIDTLLDGEGISSIDDIYGNSHYELYEDMEVGTVGKTCTTTKYGYYNKLDNHKYIRFSIENDGNYEITVEQNDGINSDPDFDLYKTSPFESMGISQESIYGIEKSKYELTAGDYILDVSDYQGLAVACFDITIN